MSNVKRVYVEKKSGFDVQAKELKTEIRSYLGIKDVDSVRVLIRYDVENVSDETFEKACNGIFSEPPVDTLYKEEFQAEEGSKIFSVEFLPGQFDQRAVYSVYQRRRAAGNPYSDYLRDPWWKRNCFG